MSARCGHTRTGVFLILLCLDADRPHQIHGANELPPCFNVSMDTQSSEPPPPGVGESSAVYPDEAATDGKSTPYSRALGERIRSCRGALSRKEFAERLRIHLNTLGKLERGETQPDALLCIQIAELGKHSVQWLVTGLDTNHYKGEIANSVHAVASGEFIYVPHFDINASAGHGDLFNSLESVLAMRPFDQAFIRGELGIAHDEIALIFVMGPSMEPLLHSRDTVLIDLRAGYESFNDGIHVIRLDQALLVKQVQKLPGKVFRIRSLNEDYTSFDIKGSEDAERDFAIIGRVRWAGVTIK
jgi:transcriptional regulator with XRE-family HTH domain